MDSAVEVGAKSVAPLSDVLRMIALPEVAVRLSIGAVVSDSPEGKVISHEDQKYLIHEEDLKIAQKAAGRLVQKMGKKMTPGRLVTACSYANQYICEQIFRPDQARIIFYTARSRASAVYRAMTPAYVLNHGTRIRASVSTGSYGREVIEFDAVGFQIDHAPSTLSLTKKLKSMGKKIIYEMDDAFENLEPWHPQYASWTHEKIESVKEMMALADLVTTTTDRLRDKFSSINPKVEVIPNLIDLAAWPSVSRDPHRDTFRVVWAGAESHKGDLDLVVPLLSKFASEDPSVRLVFFGLKPDHLTCNASQIELHPSVDFEEYYSKLASLDADVAIAPLVDCEFNRCKSNIRILQYMACGWPVVASDVQPYSETMRIPGGTSGGLLVSESKDWIHALRYMMVQKKKGVSFLEATRMIAKQYDAEAWRGRLEKAFLRLFE